MTKTQYLPQWLRPGLRKPETQKVTRLSKKEWQVLPTQPVLNQSSTSEFLKAMRAWVISRR